jgi:predicted secreted protein with PEFG-CTERM motif
MHWLSYGLMVTLILSLATEPVFAQTTQKFEVKDPQSGKGYIVNYNIDGGRVADISINQQETSLVVLLNSTNDGNLTMSMPRSLIDAKNGGNDDQFLVLVDGADSDFVEKKTDTDRTVTISFPESSQQIEVIGTQVVPEFGGLSVIVLAIAIFLIIAIFSKNRLNLVSKIQN